MSETERRSQTSSWVALGIVIGSTILAIALSDIVSRELNAILLVFFLAYLLWLADYISRASQRLRKWYAEKRERDFYKRRMSNVINRRIETIMTDIHSLVSGDGSIEKLAEKFFERPATPAYGGQNHPALSEVLPDFYQVRDLLMGDERLLSVPFSLLGSRGDDAMSQTRMCLVELPAFLNRYVAWLDKVIDEMRKRVGTCPTSALANSRSQYSRLQDNYSKLVADLDSLASAFNNAASTSPSVSSEFAVKLTKRTLGDFP